MGSATFQHFGVPTSVKQDGEVYIAGLGVHVTDPEAHPYRIEFLRFDAASWMPEVIQTQSHAAYRVDSLEEAMEGKTVVVEPFEASETLRLAFILDGDALLELQEIGGQDEAGSQGSNVL